MFKTLLLVAPLGVAALIAPSSPTVDPISPTRSIASFLPADTIAIAEAPGLLASLADTGPASYTTLLDRGEVTGLLPSQTRLHIRGGLDFARMMIGADPMDAGRHIFSNGVAIGFGFRSGAPVWGAVAHGDDEELLQDLLARAFDAIEDKFDAHGLLDSPHDHILGADIWQLGDELTLARRDSLLMASGSKSFLREMLSLAADDASLGLLKNQAFRDFRGNSAANCTLRGWVDMRQLAAVAKDKRKLAKLLELGSNPQAQFLLGPGLAGLMSGSSLGLCLTLDANGLQAQLESAEPAIAPTLQPPTGATASVPSAIQLPGATATGLFYRDIDGIITGRNKLFAPELQPKFTKSLGDIALLFGGMELDEDLFPKLGPWMQVVVKELEFGDSPQPELPLPGAVLIATVDPSIQKNLIAAFQTTVGIANTQRAQDGDLPLALNLGLEGDIMISSGHMPPPPTGEPVDANYNLAPACAYADGYFILGTHEAIVRDVVRNLSKVQSAQDTATPREQLHLSGPALAELLQQNKSYLAMQAVLDEGKSLKKANADLDMLANILSALATLDMELNYTAGGDLELTLDLAFTAPSDEAR